MANAYATVDEVKAALPDVSWGTAYDALLAELVQRASRAIDRFTQRHPGAYYVTADETRYFDGSGTRELWIDELAAAPTEVAVDEAGDGTYTVWAPTDYIPWPYNAPALGQPYLRLDVDQLNGTKSIWYRFPRSVRVTGKFGYSTAPPDDVKQATIIQAVRWFKRGQQAFQDVGAITELGQLRYLQALDPDVKALIEHLRRVAV